MHSKSNLAMIKRGKMICPCGSEKTYESCCKLYIEEDKKVPNVEYLMRSRYTAFVLKNAKYILETNYKQVVNDKAIKLLEREFDSVEWLQLYVIDSTKNEVEFKAYYRDFDEKLHVQHEHSHFVFEDGKWYYRDGVIFKSKIERNEPCPCGSGKKYKDCCAKK